MVDILLTNDDGYRSAAFVPLFRALAEEHSVRAVTPEREKSWIGKAITSKTALRVRVKKKSGLVMHVVNGTPADCVQLGLYHLAENRPNLVVSGINLGLNVGTARILSSGTIGAGMEASSSGVKALCASIEIPRNLVEATDFFSSKNHHMFESAAKITAKMAGILLHRNYTNKFDIISINIPFGATPDTELAFTRPFADSYGGLFERVGDRFSHREPMLSEHDPAPDTELSALRDGKISVTPLRLDLTSADAIRSARDLIGPEW